MTEIGGVGVGGEVDPGVGVEANMLMYLQSTSSTCLGPFINDVHTNITLRWKAQLPQKRTIIIASRASSTMTRGRGESSLNFVDVTWMVRFRFSPAPRGGGEFYLSFNDYLDCTSTVSQQFSSNSYPGSLRT